MSECEISPKAETRTVVLIGSLLVSAWLFRGSQTHSLPYLPEPFNLNEHAKHIGPGISLGFGIRYVIENIQRAKEWAFGVAVTTTTAAGFVFESSWFDPPWYRDTTLDYKDTAYTMVAGFYGALCMKNTVGMEVEAETSEINEITSLQTD